MSEPEVRTLIADETFAVPANLSIETLEYLLVKWRTTGPKGVGAAVLEVCPRDEEVALHLTTRPGEPPPRTRRLSVRVNYDLHDTNWRLMSK